MIAEPTRRGLMIGAAATLAGGAAPRPPRLAVDIGGGLLTLRGEPRFAGAVSSMTYRGVEYVDRSDHGRLFQTACHFDGWAECLNPTQAGASGDRRRSTSRLLSVSGGPGVWATSTRMAYWLRPGQLCDIAGGKRLAVNRGRLSDVTIDVEHRWGVLPAVNAALSTVTLTTTLPHASAAIEALTLYAPPGFSRLLAWDGARFAAADPAAEQPRPYALATPDSAHAFALFTPRAASPARFGGFNYGHVGKLNAVFRPPGPYLPGSHAYALAWAVGTLDQVAYGLAACT